MKSVPQTPKRAVLYARVSTEAQATDDKTSLSEQLLALRKYADAHGYEVVEEIPEEVSGRKQDTEGLEKIRDLADSGEIEAMLVYKWNRLARTVARFETFMLEMKLSGVEVVSLDGQSNETPSGRMFNRLMAVFSEYQRDDLVETMQQGKRGAARSGKVVPGRFAPYGFTYNKITRNYDVDETRMEYARRIFQMIGVEGRGTWAVKRTFDAESIPTTTGRRYWDPTTIRDSVFNDVYRPHSSEELEFLVREGNLSPDVYSALDPGRSYGIQWYNRHKTETVSEPGGRNKTIKIDRPRSEWIAVPVPDAGIPLEWVENARKSTKDYVRPSDAGRRAWSLKGFARCQCGARLVPFTLVESGKGKPRYYYVCSWHRARKGGCEYAKYYRAEEIEGRVSTFVLDLIRNPEILREQVEAEAAREKAALRDTRKQVAALAHRLAEADAERDRYNRLYARGKLTDDEYDAYTAEVAERKKAAEEELAKLEDAKRYVEYLDTVPQLVEDYLKELPQMIDKVPRIRESVIRDEYKGAGSNGHLKPHLVVPGMHRKRTPEEMKKLKAEAERERTGRFRQAYEMLDLKVVAHPDGILEISWTGGSCKLSGTRW